MFPEAGDRGAFLTDAGGRTVSAAVRRTKEFLPHRGRPGRPGPAGAAGRPGLRDGRGRGAARGPDRAARRVSTAR